MNKSIFIILIVLVVIQISSIESLKDYNQSCTNSCQCRTSYCRDGKCIRYGQVADERDKNGNSQVSPCAYTECPPGSYCYIQQVQCVRAPCPGIASCINNLTTCSYT